MEASDQGRFTSPDEFKGGPEELFGNVDPHDPIFYADIAEPQSLNKYQYVLNNPFRYVDPNGHQTTTADALKVGAALELIPHPVTKIAGAVIIGGVIGYEVYQNREQIKSSIKWALENPKPPPGGASAMQQDMEMLRLLRSRNNTDQSQGQQQQGQQSNAASPGNNNDEKPPFGSRGTQTTSTTVYQGKDRRIDVENPNPGQRAGQIHYQSGKTKLLYDPNTKSFIGASKSLNKQLMNDPQILKGIEKGLKILGESQ